MSKRPSMSRGELEVARAVWELQEATVGQVFEALSQRKTIEYSTVQTYLRRLEQKGYLRTRREGRTKIYRPRVGAKQVIRETIDDFVDQLFDGEALALMQHLVSEQKIAPHEIAQLRDLLDQWEEQHGIQ